MVEETVETIMDGSLGENPAAFLLHDTPLSNEKYENALLKHLLTAAKSCIPVLWKSNASPTRLQWMARVSEIKQMEDDYDTERTRGKILEDLESLLSI